MKKYHRRRAFPVDFPFQLLRRTPTSLLRCDSFSQCHTHELVSQGGGGGEGSTKHDMSPSMYTHGLGLLDLWECVVVARFLLFIHSVEDSFLGPRGENEDQQPIPASGSPLTLH